MSAIEVVRPPSKALLFLEWRSLCELGAFAAALPLLNFAPRGDGHPILVFPGLVASDISTYLLRSFLKSRGYVVHGWGLGRNLGLRPGVEDDMMARLDKLYGRYNRKMSLIGWSLGGIYARQLAKMMPDRVRQVITLGSPFRGDPHASNAWRLYELASGHTVDDLSRQFGEHSSGPPLVPSTAIFSRTDGVCSWQCCIETEGPQVENVEVESSHCGLGHHPAAVYALADRLAQPEHDWKPFDRSGWRSLVYPDPRRH
jgi:pimeloyl-ACP methyl ester carboxylesterase